MYLRFLWPLAANRRVLDPRLPG